MQIKYRDMVNASYRFLCLYNKKWLEMKLLYHGMNLSAWYPHLWSPAFYNEFETPDQYCEFSSIYTEKVLVEAIPQEEYIKGLLFLHPVAMAIREKPGYYPVRLVYEPLKREGENVRFYSS